MVPASAAVAPRSLHVLKVHSQQEVEVSAGCDFVLLQKYQNIPGCPSNAFAGPNSAFYYNNCPNAYAFPDNDGTYASHDENFYLLTIAYF
jgi:hypothetical protein